MSEVLRREIRNLPREEVLETLIQMWGGVGGIVAELVRRNALPLVFQNVEALGHAPSVEGVSRFRTAVAAEPLKQGMILETVRDYTFRMVKPLSGPDSIPGGVASRDAAPGEPLPVQRWGCSMIPSNSVGSPSMMARQDLRERDREQMMRWHP